MRRFLVLAILIVAMCVAAVAVEDEDDYEESAERTPCWPSQGMLLKVRMMIACMPRARQRGFRPPCSWKEEEEEEKKIFHVSQSLSIFLSLEGQ